MLTASEPAALIAVPSTLNSVRRVAADNAAYCGCPDAPTRPMRRIAWENCSVNDSWFMRLTVVDKRRGIDGPFPGRPRALSSG